VTNLKSNLKSLIFILNLTLLFLFIFYKTLKTTWYMYSGSVITKFQIRSQMESQRSRSNCDLNNLPITASFASQSSWSRPRLKTEQLTENWSHITKRAYYKSHESSAQLDTSSTNNYRPFSPESVNILVCLTDSMRSSLYVSLRDISTDDQKKSILADL